MAQPFFFLVVVCVSFFSFVALSLIVHLFPFVVRSCRFVLLSSFFLVCLLVESTVACMCVCVCKVNVLVILFVAHAQVCVWANKQTNPNNVFEKLFSRPLLFFAACACTQWLALGQSLKHR